MKPVIAFYPIGTVHMRNLALLSKALGEYEFRVLYDRRMPWFAEGATRAYPYAGMVDEENAPPDKLFEGDVRALVMSIAAISPMAAALIEEAVDRNIPVIAIEEVVQLALNQGAINHYLMPVDHLLVASDYERRAFVKVGISHEKIQVTGWPFYSGLDVSPTTERRRLLRSRFDLPEDGVVVTLFLSALKHQRDASTLETPAIRDKILSIAADGIPERVNLVIKPHPIEDMEAARNHIQTICPRARIIAGETAVGDVLDVTDVCLNRGNSQVVIESLLRRIPTLVLPCGLRTLFHGLADEAIVADPADLTRLIELVLDGGLSDNGRILATHFPWSPEEALHKVADCIREIAADRILNMRERDWIDLVLYRGMVGGDEAGRKLITRVVAKGRIAEDLLHSLERWLARRASVEDLRRILDNADAPYQRPLALSGWIRQLFENKERPRSEEMEVIQLHGPYPPAFNAHDYVRHATMLSDLYIRMDRLDLAREVLIGMQEQYGMLPSVQTAMART